MNESHFSVQNTSQKIRVIPSDIYPHFDGLQAIIGIPLNFALHPTRNGHFFDIVSVEAKLRLGNLGTLLSQTIIHPAISPRNYTWEGGKSLNFILSEKALQFIEKKREGDLVFALEITLSLLIRKELTLNPSLSFTSPEYWSTETVNLSFTIPRSVWVEKILPKIGFRNFRLIEVPLSHNQLKEAYDDILIEFNKAEQYFNAQDYNKCVAHCRNTLDALHRNLLKIKKKENIESSFKWLEKVSAETLNWITEIDKATFSLTSKSHHAGHKKDFKRYETEAIYLVVLGLLNFVGSIN